MTANEYFGDWIDVIDKEELRKVVTWVNKVNSADLCPSPKNIFRAFRACSFKDTQEDYLSPSLKIVKEAAINYEIPHNLIEFDNTLESWAKQGILMINTALTCEVGRVGAHFDIWKPFVSKLIHNMSYKDGGMIYVLFGSQAGLFKNDIVNSLKTIEVYHPAYYARTGKKMPSSVFTDINQALKQQYNYQIEFYKETEYGTC